MSQLLISTTHSKIIFDKKDERQLRSLLKEKFTKRDPDLERDPRVMRGIMSANVCFFNFDHSIIPTGLTPHLKIYCKQEGIPLEIKDFRKFIKPNDSFLSSLQSGEASLGQHILRDYQVGALLNIAKYKSGIIEQIMGSGKSLIAGAICKLYDKANILILFNKLDLIFQTYEKFTNEYDIKDVGIIGGSANVDDKRVTLLSIQSYQNAFHLFPHTDIIVMDECHETGRTPTAEKIIYSCQNASQKIGLSATVTPMENEYQKMKLHGNVGPIIHKRDYEQGRDEGTLANVSVSMYKTGTLGSIPIIGSWNDIYENVKIKSAEEIEQYESLGYEIKRNGSDVVARKFVEHGDESRLYIYNEERNALIAKLALQSERVLILFTKIAHGKELKKLLPNAVLVSGENDAKERQEAKKKLKEDKNAIVLASEIFAVGTDIPALKTLILAGSSVSNTRVLQKIGRVVRKDSETFKFDGEVIDFFQQDNSLSLKQSKKRKKIYEEIMKIPVKIV